MEVASALRFAAAARALGREGSGDRQQGGATVAVRLRDRPWAAVLADMVEGVVVANRLTGTEADRCRTALWAAAGADADRAA
jgi:hypothetical protein